MYKTLIVYPLLIFFVGCSVSGRLGNSLVENNAKEKQIIIKSKTLTNSSFFIQRADIEIINNEDKDSFLATVKYSRPDTFLISIRSKAGIEAARIFLTKDSVFINDRINKILYYGTDDALRKRYGYSNKLFYWILGGFIEDLRDKQIIFNCNNGEAYYSSYVDDMKVDYFFDCKSLEIKKIDIESSEAGRDLMINYHGKETRGDFVFYKSIEIRNISEYELVKIEIKRLEIPYKERIEFIPGRNFERVEIK